MTGKRLRNDPPPRIELNFQDTAQRNPWNRCNCGETRRVPSGRVYLGAEHCVLCGHLIDRDGTRE